MMTYFNKYDDIAIPINMITYIPINMMPYSYKYDAIFQQTNMMPYSNKYSDIAILINMKAYSNKYDIFHINDIFQLI